MNQSSGGVCLAYMAVVCVRDLDVPPTERGMFARVPISLHVYHHQSAQTRITVFFKPTHSGNKVVVTVVLTTSSWVTLLKVVSGANHR